MKRTFLAITTSDNTSRLISSIFEDLPELEEKVKPANPNNPHITVKFLGDTEEDNIIPLIRDLKQKFSDFNKFGFEIDGTGVFPAPSNPRVFWLGVGKGKQNLKKMHKNIEEVTQKYDVKPDKHDFTPHITIGRKKKNNQLKNLNDFLDYSFKPEFNQAEEIVFFESILKHSGAEHKIIDRIKLRG